MMSGGLFPTSYFVRGNQEIPMYLIMILCQRMGAVPQLSIGLILMAMLHCCFLAGAVHSLLKLQFANKLDQAEKLQFFQIESEN